VVNRTTLVYTLMAAAALLRLLPHPLNMTPIGALALFSGAHLHSRWAYVIPLVALLIGDVLLGWFDLTVMLGVYIGFLLTTLVGRLCLHQKQSSQRYVVAVVAGALVFYLISNIGMWHSYWPRTLDGLIACYIEGLPFLARTLIGDGIYAALMFGGYEWLVKKQSTAQQASLTHASPKEANG
jgi:hypothetical protein